MFVCTREITKAQRMRRTGWASCSLVRVCVCVFVRGGFRTTRIMTMTATQKVPPTPLPAVLLSPCLRFGFGTRFEPRQWFPIAAELPGFFIPGAARRRAKRLLAAQSLVLLTSGPQRRTLWLTSCYIQRHTDLTPALYGPVTAPPYYFFFHRIQEKIWCKCSESKV